MLFIQLDRSPWVVTLAGDDTVAGVRFARVSGGWTADGEPVERGSVIRSAEGPLLVTPVRRQEVFPWART